MKTLRPRPMKNLLPSMIVYTGFFACTLLTTPHASLGDGLQGVRVGSPNTGRLGTPGSVGTGNSALQSPTKLNTIAQQDPILGELNRLTQETSPGKSDPPSEREESEPAWHDDPVEPDWVDFAPATSDPEISLEEVRKYVNAPKIYDAPLRSDSDEGVGPYEHGRDIPMWVDGSYMTEGSWTYFRHRGVENGAAQGIKLHVSAAANEERVTIERATEYLQKNLIPHKVATKTGYEKFVGGTQEGKLITIYPKDEDQAKELIEKLNELAASNDLQRADAIQGEARVGPNVFARYGQSYYQRGVPDGYLKTPEGGFERDERGAAPWPTWYTPPPWLTEMVKENTPSDQ